jgi:uncharacterized glyoxalase superfamily protein PhnB
MKEELILRTITVLPAKDIVTSAAWYDQTLGFRTMVFPKGNNDDHTHYAILKREHLEIHLYLNQSEEMSSGILYLKVSDIDEAFEEVKIRNTTIKREPEMSWYGLKNFILEDPDGNHICIEQEQVT